MQFVLVQHLLFVTLIPTFRFVQVSFLVICAFDEPFDLSLKSYVLV